MVVLAGMSGRSDPARNFAIDDFRGRLGGGTASWVAATFVIGGVSIEWPGT